MDQAIKNNKNGLSKIKRRRGDTIQNMKNKKPITDKEEKRINEWLKKQAKYQLIRESRNYQRVK